MASTLLGVVQPGLVFLVFASFPSMLLYKYLELPLDRPGPSNGNNVHAKSYHNTLLSSAQQWLVTVGVLLGIFVVSLLIVTGGGWLWASCAPA